MATKNFRSTVLEPTSEFAHGDKLRFTALATVGEVLKGSFSETTIGEDGVYSVDLQYGKHRIDYKPYEGVWRHFADVEVNADTLATTLQDLALASVPVTDDAVLVLQGILADAEAAKTAAETAEAAAETALASIDSKIAEVDAGYPSMLAAQLSKSVTVNATTGDDATADGSSAKPFKTIKAAIESQVDSSYVSVSLQGGIDKATAHVIDSTINISMRYISINMNSNHVILSDSLSFVFSAISCTLTIGNGGFMHASTSKTILKTEQGSRLGIGGYYACTISAPADASIILIYMTYLSRSGASEVNTYKLLIVDTDMTTPSSAQVKTASFEASGSACFFCHSNSSLGNNYSDSTGFTTVLAGSFKVCSS